MSKTAQADGIYATTLYQSPAVPSLATLRLSEEPQWDLITSCDGSVLQARLIAMWRRPPIQTLAVLCSESLITVVRLREIGCLQ